MTSTSASPKKSLDEILNEAAQVTPKKKKATATVEQEEETAVSKKFATIAENAFYKIIFSDASPEEKKKSITTALTYKAEESNEQNKARLEEFNVFKEYLQHQRKEMAKELIKMTDTGAFAELKSAYDELNNAVLEFDNNMKPLVDIIDAVFELRQAGVEVSQGVFREIKEDQAREAKRLEDLKAQETRLAELQQSIRDTNRDIAVLGEQKGLFGFGIKKSAREAIASRTVDLTEANAEIAAAAAEIEKLKSESTAQDSKYAEYANQKAQLRQLLDITSDGHKERQEKLVSAALNFVERTEERVESVMEHYHRLTNQLDNLSTTNYGMTNVYAVVTDATAEASKANKATQLSVSEPKEGEGLLDKMKREDSKRFVDEYITAMDHSAIDTARSYADLATQGARINTMKETNQDQIAKTRALQSQGVAGVADRLCTVLTTVATAALNESHEMAQMTVMSLSKRTDEIAVKESLRSAMGAADLTDSFNIAVDGLAQYAKGLEVAKQIKSENLDSLKEAKQKMEAMIGEVQTSLKDYIATNAEVDLSNSGVAAPAAKGVANENKPATTAPANPFTTKGFGG